MMSSVQPSSLSLAEATVSADGDMSMLTTCSISSKHDSQQTSTIFHSMAQATILCR